MFDSPASGAKRRVLFVDDDPAFGRSLERDFGTRAFDVDWAGTADEAIAHVAAVRPDLVVLDLYLADGAALKLLRLWKSQAPELVVLLVSGNASLVVVVDALKEGARRFFTKPVSAATLLEELDGRPPAKNAEAAARLVVDHHLGTAALEPEGVDRFFTISPGLLSVAGFDGYFKMLNPAWEKALGFSIDELCSTPYLELVHPEDREKATDEALEIRGGQTVFRFRNRYRCKDGSYRWLSWLAMPSPAHHLIYASARDVTHVVRMEHGLRTSNAKLKEVVAAREVMLGHSVELGLFKDEVAATIVHDLKNPLSVIVANYDYLVEGFEGSAECLEALRESQSAGRRMLRLLSNLVDVERIEEGTLPVRAAPIGLLRVLESVASQRRVLAASRQIAVVFVPGREVTLVVDADLLTRTIENIFDNALRHTPSGGTIEIEVREAGPDIEVRIGNSGRAIPVEARGAIFEKYRQRNGDVGRMNLGLGLYFCRLATETQGGTVWVEGTERMPTVFCIRLPRLAARPQGPTAARAVAEPSRT